MKYTFAENNRVFLKETNEKLTFKKYEKEVVLYGAFNYSSFSEHLYAIRLALPVYEEQAEKYFDDLVYISINYPDIEDICNLFPNMDKTVYDVDGDKCYCFKLAYYDRVNIDKAKSICRSVTPEMIQSSLPKYKHLFLGSIIDDVDNGNHRRASFKLPENYGIYIKAGIANTFNRDSSVSLCAGDLDLIKKIVDRFTLDFERSGIRSDLNNLAYARDSKNIKEAKKDLVIDIDCYIKHCLEIFTNESVSKEYKDLKLILKEGKDKIDTITFIRYMLQCTLYDNPKILADILMENTDSITCDRVGAKILSYMYDLVSEDKIYKTEDVRKVIDDTYATKQAKSKSRTITIKRASTGRTVTMRV